MPLDVLAIEELQSEMKGALNWVRDNCKHAESKNTIREVSLS